MMPYERLEAWQRCHKLAVEVYLTTKEKFPPEERLSDCQTTFTITSFFFPLRNQR